MLAEAQAVKDIVKANAEALYKDAAQPSVRVVGRALAQCTSLFATPVGRVAEIFEKNIHRYLDKLEGLNDDQIVPPDTRILVPILEKLRYTDDELVANYYAQILATASTPEGKRLVSVAFIEILNRLCADEIKMLEFINSDKNILPVEKENAPTLLLGMQGVLPVLNVHVANKDEGYVVAIKNLSYLLGRVQLDSPANYNLYMDNMIALGLLLKPAMVRAQDNDIYTQFKKDPAIKEIESRLKEDQHLGYSEGRIEITDLGLKLLEVGSTKN